MNENQLRNTLEKIDKLGLAEETKALALTALYMTNNQDDAAIRVLEKAIANGSKNAGIYRILGDIYLHLGLNQFRVAEKFYGQAIELSANHEDSIEKVAAAAGLAKIEVNLKKEEEAKDVRQEMKDGRSLDNVKESVLEAAVRDAISQDKSLAHSISLANTCPVAVCINGRYKPHQYATCRACASG